MGMAKEKISFPFCWVHSRKMPWYCKKSVTGGHYLWQWHHTRVRENHIQMLRLYHHSYGVGTTKFLYKLKIEQEKSFRVWSISSLCKFNINDSTEVIWNCFPIYFKNNLFGTTNKSELRLWLLLTVEVYWEMYVLCFFFSHLFYIQR